MERFLIGYMDESLCLLIIQFCPNLKEFYIIIEDDGLNILKIIFESCQYLESIKIMFDYRCQGMEGIFEAITKYSPKSFYELKLYKMDLRYLFPKDLESILISWKNQKS